ncbi:MAG: lipoyl(octanoyl) transferase LipB [Rickettsiaceae bacterium]|nr:lipoyl(octanoyl) transferase LipB [Rickettsiaceae bacterium]
MRPTKWIHLEGLTDYDDAAHIMSEYLEKIITDTTHPNVIMLVEHKDVYTAGLSYRPEELLNPGDIPVIYTHRGGKFTYHGPGQRVIYPIINLRNTQDIRRYVRDLEQWVINSLTHYGIKAYLLKDLIGIWIDHPILSTPAKIASIGVKVRKWVAYHGIAVNITTNINRFSNIIPCGINNYPVTSMKEAGIDTSFEEFDKILTKEFDKIFKYY